MLRMLFTLIISASIGRWMYSEVELIAPPLVPIFNTVLNATDLPTHDKWSKNSFEQLIRAVNGIAQNCVTGFSKQPKAHAQPQRVKHNGPTFKEINQELTALQEQLNKSSFVRG